MMLSNYQRRGLAFVLAFAMTFSLIPVTGFATETEPVTVETTVSETEPAVMETTVPETTVATEAVTEPITETESVVVLEAISEIKPATETVAAVTSVAEGNSTEDSLLQQIEVALSTYVKKYGISSDMSDEDLANAYFALDSESSKAAWDEAWEIDTLSENLTDADREKLSENEHIPTITRFLKMIETIITPQIIAEGTVADGKIKINGSKGSLSNGIWTDAASASGFIIYFAGEFSTTVTNTTSEAATISFDWTASGAASLTINGTDYTGETGGNYSVPVEGGKSITITGKSAGSKGSKVTFTMKNFSYAVKMASSQITINYTSSLGQVKQNGTTIENGATVSITEDTVFTASALNGGQFVGWIDTNDKILSRSTDCTISSTGNQTVTAVFADNTPYFYTKNNTYLKVGLSEAISFVGTMTIETIALANNATLVQGDYTIPENVTLLIPFDKENTLYTTEPGAVNGAYTTPTPFRTLTMKDGAKITVEGALSLSAKINAQNSPNKAVGSPYGPVSFIKMNEGSSITVAEGGSLYAWGFITGLGSITAQKGSFVYECFQFEDFRGGTQASNMKNKVFPLSQYYIQNIEVPLTLENGAIENCYSAVYMRVFFSNQVVGTTINFFGSSNAMYNITSGSLKKYYDGSTDRLIIEINGDVTLSVLKLTFGNTPIDSSEYNLPINGNITVHIQSGSITVGQDVAMLPGSQLIIDEGTKCTLSSGKSFYVYDQDEWGGYCNTYNSVFFPLTYAPGRTYNRKATDLIDVMVQVDGTFDASKGYLYTTASGANICSTGAGEVMITPGTATVTHQFHQYDADSSKENTYIEIPITSAKLKHEDGTYLLSATGTYVYSAEHGKWVLGEHTTEPTITAPTSASLGSAKLDCPCGYSYKKDIHVMLQAIEASADAEVILKQKFFVPKELVDAGVYAVLTKPTLYDSPPADYEDETKTITLSELTPDGSGRYVLNMGVASGEMTCPVTVQFFDKDGKELTVLDYVGNAIGTEVSRSVVDYADRVLKVSSNEGQKKIITALVTYGGYAQKYFEVDTEHPAYSILGETAPTVDATISDEYSANGSIGITLANRQAYLDSAIYLRSYFTLDNAEDSIDNYTFTLTYTENHVEKTKQLTPKTETVTRSGAEITRHYVDILDIPAAYLEYMYEIEVTKAGVDGRYIVNTSVLAYLNSLIQNSENDAQIALAKAMYLYNKSANEFFGK